MDLDTLPQPEYEGTISPDELTVDGRNPNEMNSSTFRLLCNRIRTNGWLSGPIIADTDGVVADGEHRLRAAREIGLDSVPVQMHDIDDARRRLWRQELNKISGEHDTKRDAIEYDLLMEDGLVDEVEEISEANEEDLEELLDEVAEMDQEAEELSNTEPANDPYAEWDDSGPVDYENEDQTPDYSIKVNFATLSDMREFRELVGQDFNAKSESIWFPEKERETFGDRRYVMGERENAEAGAGAE